MMSIETILKILPHRYPFLLVDGVVEVTPNKIQTFKNVSFNEPHFVGHFPDRPVMPGVLIIEAMAQSGAILAHQSGDFDPTTHNIYFMTIEKAKFRQPVIPGDRLNMEVIPLRKGQSVWKLHGQAQVSDQVVASADFTAMIVKKSE